MSSQFAPQGVPASAPTVMTETTRVSTSADDPPWDAFLERTQGGGHLQCSGWARSKAGLGWSAVRVVIQRDEQIVGGAQLLLRRLPIIGRVGLVVRGPVIESPDDALMFTTLTRLQSLARRVKVSVLIVQPPMNGGWMIPHLKGRGFLPSITLPHPRCTLVTDVQQDDEALLRHIRPSTRRNLRLAAKRGVTIVEGSKPDLPVFYRLLSSTARRQHFGTPGLSYFQQLWSSMTPSQRITLRLAMYQGEAVSGGLFIRFGDTVTYKRGAWSGTHSAWHPNELLHWETMRWARTQGCRYYDLDGIDEAIAHRAEAGVASEVSDRQSVTQFKLGLGGTITWSPGAYELVANPVLRATSQLTRDVLRASGLTRNLEALLRRW
jgi:lipid II:glycine glycyltransferase (peptidoglycan interpeptide bridge formation enzyme)